MSTASSGKTSEPRQTTATSTPMTATDTPTALLVLKDGTVLPGRGVGAVGEAVGEVCFNTAMTGYQEILTDPSYAGQIVTFTFPHIGNVGANDEDIETSNLASASDVRGLVIRADITNPSNYRAAGPLDAWLKTRGSIGLSGLDTRALTRRIREKGAVDGLIAHDPSGKFDIPALLEKARGWPGMVGLDLVQEGTCGQSDTWNAAPWHGGCGYEPGHEPTHRVDALGYALQRQHPP